jgi:hypothetical protein
MRRTIITLLCLASILTGCINMPYRLPFEVRDEFDKSSRDYNQMLRWADLHNAVLTYADKATRAEFEKQLAPAKGVKIVDYRVKGVDYDEDKKSAEVLVDFDYYTPSGITVKTVEDTQKWRYVEKTGWRIMSMPPDFK